MDYKGKAKDFLGMGFRFPIQVDDVTGRFQMSSYEEDIKEAISIIINTRPGERLMRREFGCHIHDYIFDSMNYTVLSSMKEAVKEALILWEPRIKEIEVKAETESAEAGTVYLSVSYVVRSTNNPYNLVFPFYLNEGIGAEA